ncbi:hypothetical protein AB0323_19900 [Arthrobacter sp. NPDC080031]|uniref:hypothetical protein n=1 Tax=Arthrobacter sp. NPDC080031 TaxID=3155918 RepID=UPI00344DAD80
MGRHWRRRKRLSFRVGLPAIPRVPAIPSQAWPVIFVILLALVSFGVAAFALLRHT